MKNILKYIYKNSQYIYKGLIFFSALVFIVYLFSQTSQFQYQYIKNKPWQYKDLIAPFDFTVKKSQSEIEKEKSEIINATALFLKKQKIDTTELINKLDKILKQSGLNKEDVKTLLPINHLVIPKVYQIGLLEQTPADYVLQHINLVSGNTLKKVLIQKIFTKEKLSQFLKKYLSDQPALYDYLIKIYNKHLPVNLIQDDIYYKNFLNQRLENISINKGMILKGQTIIKKGELIDADKYEIINSLKSASGFNPKNYFQKIWTYIGFTVIVAMTLLMLFLFLRKFRPDIFENNIKVSLILFNMLLILTLTALTVKYYPSYIFVVPIVILPLILKAFFDERTGLFVHVLTVLLLGFIVTNSFEFVFLQIMAGIVTILTVSELTKRSNLFMSVGEIVLVYILGYMAFHLIYEGYIGAIDYSVLLKFIFNGILAIALSHQLILLYEKTFGLVSDVSLLEYTNTNSKLLKRLADKAPGTFNHSMQVANLAESAAQAVHANALLVRAGALYHDIGKMLNPFYFTENQISGVNYHDDLPPEDSARIIIQHVLDGVELARKNNLPDRIIDFIRTHHGTGLVQYFYKKALKENPNVDKKKFAYPGPIPFNKETAILMMADSVEAASKSLREPTTQKIDDFVDKIIDNQLHSGLLDNANITLKEISIIKKLFKKKLKNIYHLRVEYPD